MTQTNALVIATFRDDEVDQEHPLRDILGHIATAPSVRRLGVAALSPGGVRYLAREREVDAAPVHRITGGNPFFVTEVLASPDTEVPGSVSDAVLVRAHRLSKGPRAVLDLASVIPDQPAIDLLLEVSGQEASSVEACVDAGLVLVVGTTLRFRHELARLAIEGAIPPVRRRALHREILAWLAARSGVPRARFAYHAEQADDPHAILTFAPPAAEEATRLGTYREAYDHLERALPHAGLLPDAERAELLESFVRTSRAVGRFEDAFRASREALDLRERLSDIEAEASILVQAAMSAWSLARNAEARQMAARAVELVDRLPAGPSHAQVYAVVASLRMLGRDIAGAIELGTCALALAEEHGDSEARIVALGAVGAGESRRYETADRWLAEAARWCKARDLDYHGMYVAAWSARSAFEQGRSAEADNVIGQLLRSPLEDRPTRIVMLTVQGRLAARRVEPLAADRLREAWELAVRTGDLQRLWPAAAGRAELAWLAGDTAAVGELVRETYELALRLEQGWAV